VGVSCCTTSSVFFCTRSSTATILSLTCRVSTSKNVYYVYPDCILTSFNLKVSTFCYIASASHHRWRRPSYKAVSCAGKPPSPVPAPALFHQYFVGENISFKHTQRKSACS
jgi:hypothetical protein